MILALVVNLPHHTRNLLSRIVQMMTWRRSRFVYLLALALLLHGGAAAQRLAPFDETDQMVRGFEDRLMFYLFFHDRWMEVQTY
jgi:hypothetical protein